jgi:TPR repeat protein
MRVAVFIAIGLVATSISVSAAAEPNQQSPGAISDLAGEVNAWRLIPDVLLARCVKEAPERDAALREVHESWSKANASLIGMIDRVLDRVAPLVSANVSTESTAEARNRIDAFTTDLINETYFKKESVSASQACADYEKIVADLSAKGRTAATRGFVYALEAMLASSSSTPVAVTGPNRKPETLPVDPRALKCRDEGPAAEQSGILRLSVAALSERAQTGDAMAQNELGRRYGLGLGVAKDSATSFSWYEKAADHGLCSAQANLAYMYLNGEGVGKNGKLAELWYIKAAESGSDRAQYALGYMYITGAGVEKNGPIAEKWFLMAANQGFVSAQRALMRMYEDGNGVPRDPAKAILWLHRVRDAGLTGKPWRQE